MRFQVSQHIVSSRKHLLAPRILAAHESMRRSWLVSPDVALKICPEAEGWVLAFADGAFVTSNVLAICVGVEIAWAAKGQVTNSTLDASSSGSAVCRVAWRIQRGNWIV